MSYFLIYQNDKEATVKQVTKEEVKEMIEDEGNNLVFTKTIKDNDPACWGENVCLLIKGEIIVPKPVKVVTEYEID